MALTLEDLLDSMNIRELISITAGLVGSQIINDAVTTVDPKVRDLAKIGVGLVVPAIIGMTGGRGGLAGIAPYVSLAATAIAADTIANRINISLASKRAVRIVAAYPTLQTTQTTAPAQTRRVVSI